MRLFMSCANGVRNAIACLAFVVLVLHGPAAVEASYSDDWYSSNSDWEDLSNSTSTILLAHSGTVDSTSTWSLGSSYSTSTTKTYAWSWSWYWNWDTYTRYLNSFCERYPSVCNYDDNCRPGESAPVPEPSSWLLLGAGVLVSAIAARRRSGEIAPQHASPV